MANISEELSQIMTAVYGRQVRKSIHDAIRDINTASENILGAGTLIDDGDPVGSSIDPDLLVNALYFNTSTNDLLKCDGIQWSKVDNLEGNAITSITGPTSLGLIDTYTIHFSKTENKTFEVANGKGISSITGPSTQGLEDTYTINFNDGTTQDYVVTNGLDGQDGKDGNTVIRGNEVTGTAINPTQFTLSVKCQTGDTYINTSGNVYTCTQGAEANAASLWKYDFGMAGGTGGAQYLYELSDVDHSSTTQHPTPGQILQYDSTVGWKASDGGSGHTMKPLPSSQPDEDDIVDTINDVRVVSTNNEVASLYGIQRWTNVKTFRVIISSGIGHYGVGEWKDAIVGTPTKAEELTWGWYYHSFFETLGNLQKNGYDIDLKFKFDPSNSEVVTLGGYILDTDTGCLCIKFANYVIDTANTKIGVDVTIVRNDVSYV